MIGVTIKLGSHQSLLIARPQGGANTRSIGLSTDWCSTVAKSIDRMGWGISRQDEVQSNLRHKKCASFQARQSKETSYYWSCTPDQPSWNPHIVLVSGEDSPIEKKDIFNRWFGFRTRFTLINKPRPNPEAFWEGGKIHRAKILVCWGKQFGGRLVLHPAGSHFPAFSPNKCPFSPLY